MKIQRFLNIFYIVFSGETGNNSWTLRELINGNAAGILAPAKSARSHRCCADPPRCNKREAAMPCGCPNKCDPSAYKVGLKVGLEGWSPSRLGHGVAKFPGDGLLEQSNAAFWLSRYQMNKKGIDYRHHITFFALQTDGLGILLSYWGGGVFSGVQLAVSLEGKFSQHMGGESHETSSRGRLMV